MTITGRSISDQMNGSESGTWYSDGIVGAVYIAAAALHKFTTKDMQEGISEKNQ